MTDPDDLLLDRLRTAASVRTEAVPALSRAAARSAFTWRSVDDELARLGYDSTLDRALAGVRGGDGPRLVTFEAAGVVVDLEVSLVGGKRSLIGQATGVVVRLQLQRAGGLHGAGAGDDLDLDVDEQGTFRADGVDGGVVRLRCTLSDPAAGPRVVSTEWVTI